MVQECSTLWEGKFQLLKRARKHLRITNMSRYEELEVVVK